MVLNLSKATDEQIKNILKYDNSIPKDLLKIVLEEAMNRDLLKGFVIYTIKHRVSNIKEICEKNNVTFEDLIQVAYISIWNAVNTFKKGKAGFLPCSYIPIQRGITTMARKGYSQKRTGETVSIQTPVYEELTLEEMLPNDTDIERYILNKIDLENRLNKLDEKRKKVVLMYTNGYNFPEIGKIMGYSKAHPRKLYLQALEIMRGA